MGRSSRKPARTANRRLFWHVLSGFELCFERIGLEACSLTAWMHEGLRLAGLPAICIESRHAKAAMGAMPNRPIAMTHALLRRLCEPERTTLGRLTRWIRRTSAAVR